MKKLSHIIVFTLLLPSIANAQHVSLLTVDALNSRLRAGGDTTFVLNFWATWCRPCLAELPYFEKLQQQYRSDKLKVLLVSVDFKSELQKAVIPFVKKHNLKNNVYLLDEKSQQLYIDKIDSSWSGAIPATLFATRDRRRFYETGFDYAQLVASYQKFKTP